MSQAGSRPNPAQRLGGVVVSPDSTLRDIATRPDWVVPLLLILVLSLASSVIVSPRIDFETSVREQLLERGMSQTRIDETVQAMEKFRKFSVPLTALFVPVILLIITGALLVGFKLFGGEGTFKQSWAVTLYSWLPQMLKGLIATLLIVRAGTLTVEELQTLLKSNLGFVVDPSESPVIFALLSSLDVFNIWTAALLGIGSAHAHRFSFARGFALVLALWGLFILGRMGIAALQTVGGAG